MAKTIKEMMQKVFWETDISDHPAKAFEQGYEAGANAVLEEVESVVQDIIDFDEGIIDSDSHSYDKNIYQIWNMLLQLKGE